MVGSSKASVLLVLVLFGCGGGAFSAGDEKVARDDAGDAGDEGTAEAAAPDARAGQPEGAAGDDAGAEAASNVDADTGKSCQTGNAMWPGVCCYLPAVAGCAFVETSPGESNVIPACCAPDEPLWACEPSTPATASKSCD